MTVEESLGKQKHGKNLKYLLEIKLTILKKLTDFLNIYNLLY